MTLYTNGVEPLFDFITSTGGKITGAIVAVLIIIIIISYIDRHPGRKDNLRSKSDKHDSPGDGDGDGGGE